MTTLRRVADAAIFYRDGLHECGMTTMLNPTPAWRAFERQDEAATYGRMSFLEALERFERLWRHARAVNPAAGEDWEDDLAADLAIARAVNGLPPRC